MKKIERTTETIGPNYITTTNRLLIVQGTESAPHQRVALMGDSTIDNGFWVQKDIPYARKTATVSYQTCNALAHNESDVTYQVATFAVDGATTSDINKYYFLNNVLGRGDEDHPSTYVHQMASVTAWNPDVVVLSVAGNNYRVALQGTLTDLLTTPQLLSRQTPQAAKEKIKKAFSDVKIKLLDEYKNIIDTLSDSNNNIQRLVLVSQYYPELTQLTRYFIYTGFSHVARAEDRNQTAFGAIEETMNELYREVLAYAATKNKDVVFVDATSSLNPLGNNHVHQIEPNERGSKIMGQLIAAAVAYQYPKNEDIQEPQLALIRMNKNEQDIETRLLNQENIKNYSVKPLSKFIAENRYRHVRHFFRPSSSLLTRYESAYHMVMGKEFDAQYTDLFAFGLLDLSVVTVLASYLMRVALEEQHHNALRVSAAVIAVPILLVKAVIGLAVMLALSLPIYGYHQLAKQFHQEEMFPVSEDVDCSQSPASDALRCN